MGSRLPGMMTMVAVRTMASTIGRNISANRDTGAHAHQADKGTNHTDGITGAVQATAAVIQIPSVQRRQSQDVQAVLRQQ